MSAYIHRTPTSTGNRKTWTFSAWIKRGAMADNECVFSQCSTSTYNSNTHLTDGTYFKKIGKHNARNSNGTCT